MDWPIERKVQCGLGIALAVLFALGMIARALMVSFVKTSDWVIHTHLVIERTQAARTGLDDCETAVRGYLLTHDKAYLAPYDLIHERIPGLEGDLQILTTDNIEQRQKMDQLKLQIDHEMALLQKAVESERSHSASDDEKRKLLDEEQEEMTGIRNVLRAARLRENQLLVVRDAEWRANLTRAIVAAAILGLFNLVLLGYIYYAFKSDLSERRRAEAALRASEERLRLLVGSAKDYAIFMLDASGRVATWNDGARLIKGYEASEIVGRPFSTFFSEEDRKLGKPEAATEQAANLGRVEIEGWRVRKDGSRFWADAITSAIRDEAGRLLGYSEVARDLTERKLAEQKLEQSQSRLAAILDGSPSVICAKDPEGHYTLVNRRFEDAFQLKREDVLGKTDMDLFPMATAQRLREHDRQAQEAGKALEFEEVIPHKNRPHTYLSARVPLLGEDKQAYALCAVFTDITERKESEQEIQRLNRALQDRVVDRSVQLMQAADELKIERVQREGAEEREREVHDLLRDVIQNSPVPIWTYDLETLELLEVNPAAVVLCGYSREELLHMRITDLYAREEVHKLGNDVKTGAPNQGATAWECRSKNGQMIPLEIMARRVDWEGRETVLLAVVSGSQPPRLEEMARMLEAAESGA